MADNDLSKLNFRLLMAERLGEEGEWKVRCLCFIFPYFSFYLLFREENELESWDLL